MISSFAVYFSVIFSVEGVDENACIILKYRDGGMASLTYHTNAGVGENTAAIYGDKGKILVGYCYHFS